MSALTPARLAEIEAAADAATEGPWYAQPKYSVLGKRLIVAEAGPIRVTADAAHEMQPAGDDATFIAMARTAVPELVAEVRRLAATERKLRDALRAMAATFKPFTSRPMGAPGSVAREEQEDQIAAYAAARTALGDKP